MGQEPKKVDRRSFLYAGLGAVALIAIGAAAYIAMNPPVVTQTTTVSTTIPTISVVTTKVPTTTVVTTTTATTVTTTVPSTSTTTTPKFAKLKMITWSGAPIVEAVNMFNERYKGQYEIEFTAVPWYTIGEKIFSDLAADPTAYDLLTPNVESLWLTSPFIEDLTPWIKRYNFDFEGIYNVAAKEAGTAWGRIVGFHWRQNALNILMYNKDYFEMAGINAPPKDYEDFVEYAKKLTMDVDKDGKIDVYGTGLGLMDPSNLSKYFESWIHMLGGRILDETETKPDDSLKVTAEKVLKFMKELYNANILLPGSEIIGIFDIVTAFQERKVAMIFDTTPRISLLENANKSPKIAGKVGYYCGPLVNVGGQKPGFIMGGWFASINNRIPEERKEVAWKFLEFISEKEVNIEITRKVGNTPGVKSVYEDPRIVDVLPKADVIAEAHNLGVKWRARKNTEISSVEYELVWKVLKDQISPSEAANTFFERVKSIVAVS